MTRISDLLKYTSVAFMFMIVGGPATALAQHGLVAEGNAFFEQEAYADAVTKYKEALKMNPESDKIHFNLGTALYKQGKYSEALDNLQKSLLTDDESLKNKAYYNLGNAFYRQGMTDSPQDLDAAIGSLENAVQYYDQALEQQPEDSDAQFNKQMAEEGLKRLQELRQQQQRQQQKQPSSDESSSDKKEPQDSESSEEQESGAQQPQDTEKASSGQDEQQEKSSEKQAGQKETSPESETPQAGDEPPEKPSPEESSSGQEQKSSGTGEEATGSNQTENDQDFDRREAEMLLRDYQQSEEPQGLLNFMQRQGHEAPVPKDW